MKSIMNFLNWYQVVYERRPMLTKMATGGVTSLTGDFVCQMLERSKTHQV